MSSILLGLGAALAWGVHDLLVRKIGGSVAITLAMTWVLTAGTVFCLPFLLIYGGWGEMGRSAVLASIAAGGCFVLAYLGLYRAFAEGPVKLVAPIIGAYPILSVGWAELAGRPVALSEWIAVAIIVLGVALVALLSDPEDTPGQRNRAILFAALSGVGFAATFALSQAAVRAGSEWPVIVLTRVTAILIVLGLVLAIRPARAMPGQLRPTLVGMGILDGMALALVAVAGTLPNPEFAAVCTSIFGVITIVLARIFLKEPLSAPQWASVGLVFAGVGFLGL